MADLDPSTVLSLGGWDPRYVRVLFVAQVGDLGLALVNADSDINLDSLKKGPGGWQAGSSMSADESGPGLLDGVAYHYGQKPPGTEVLVAYAGAQHKVTTGADGWWVFMAPADETLDVEFPELR